MRVLPTKPLTLKDIAKATGFSPSTVSAAFSARPDRRYREATLLQVREAAEKLGFRVNRQARLLRGGRSQTILLLKNITLHQMMAEITLELQAALGQENYQLISSDLVPSMKIEQIRDMVADFKVDGIILGNIPLGARLMPIVEECLDQGVKVVSIEGCQIPGGRVFTGDYYGGHRALMNHLVESGCREIALVVLEYDLDNPFQWRTQQAIAAFDDTVLKRRGIRGEVIASPTVGFHRSFEKIYFEPGRRMMETLLERRRRPDAVVFLNDLFAIGALRYCHEQGVDVPGELKIAGCDYTATGQHVSPTLTTLKIPYDDICRRAVRYLLDEIEGRDLEASGDVVALPLEVVIGESTRGTGG